MKLSYNMKDRNNWTIFIPYEVPILVAVGILGTALGIILGSIGFFVNLKRNTKEVV